MKYFKGVQNFQAKVVWGSKYIITVQTNTTRPIVVNCYTDFVATFCNVTHSKSLVTQKEKLVLNLTLPLTLTLGLPAKHNDVFHCLYEGKFN